MSKPRRNAGPQVPFFLKWGTIDAFKLLMYGGSHAHRRVSFAKGLFA